MYHYLAQLSSLKRTDRRSAGKSEEKVCEKVLKTQELPHNFLRNFVWFSVMNGKLFYTHTLREIFSTHEDEGQKERD